MAWRSNAVEMTRRRAGRIDSRRLSRDVSIMISLLTGAIVAISFAAAPDLWREWVDVLATSESSGLAGTPGWYLPIPLLVRLPAAVILVAWGALTGRAWSVPVAALLALPVVWFNSFSMLVAVVALRRPGVRAG